MKGFMIAAAAFGTFAGLSCLNYRRFVPKPRAMSGNANKVEVRKFPVDLNARIAVINKAKRWIFNMFMVLYFG